VTGVVVDDVVRAAVGGRRVDRRERARDVVGLELRLLDVVGMRLLEHGGHLDGRARARRREQRHVVAALRQPLAEQADDLLDSPVRGWRHRNPGRCQHRDSHQHGVPATLG
jgi:hypothetical protein